MINLRLVFGIVIAQFLLAACGSDAQFETSGVSAKLGQPLSMEDSLGSEIVINDEIDEGQIHIEEIEWEKGTSCHPGDKDHKVLVCHHPSGNIENRHEICISKATLKAHLDRHGSGSDRSYLGECH